MPEVHLLSRCTVGKSSVFLQWSLGQKSSLKKKKIKIIQSYVLENAPGIFWVYSSEETNLQENKHKSVDNTLLSVGSHG